MAMLITYTVAAFSAVFLLWVVWQSGMEMILDAPTDRSWRALVGCLLMAMAVLATPYVLGVVWRWAKAWFLLGAS